MTLPEFAVMEKAYTTLSALDRPARQRAVEWLAAALQAEDDSVVSPKGSAAADHQKAPTETGIAQNGASAVPATATSTADEPVAPTADDDISANVEVSAQQPRQRRRAGAGGSTRQTTATRAATQAPSKRAGKSPASTQKTDDSTSRPQARRGMPPASDIMKVYKTTGTIKGVADHFGKSVGTAQNWAAELRSQGHEIGRSKKP